MPSYDDILALEAAAQANPGWLKAVVEAGKVMASRRKKWSGKSNPYANFIRLAQMNGASVEQTFFWLTTLKLTRDQDSEAEDDSLLDNDIDKVNYPALGLGWRLLPPAEKLACMLELGVWVDHRLLKKWSLEDGEVLQQGTAAS